MMSREPERRLNEERVKAMLAKLPPYSELLLRSPFMAAYAKTCDCMPEEVRREAIRIAVKYKLPNSRWLFDGPDSPMKTQETA